MCSIAHGSPEKVKDTSILFVSRDCLLSGQSGGSSYAKDILTYLSESGANVELVLLKPRNIKYGCLLPAFLPGTGIRLRSPSFCSIFGRNINWLALALLPFRLILAKCLTLQRPVAAGTIHSRGTALMRWLVQLPYPTHPPLDVSYFEADPTPGETKYILKLLRREKHRILFLNYICLTPILDIISADTHLLKVVLAHDLWYMRAKNLRAVGLETDLKEWTEEAEASRYQKADLVIGISWEEREHFIRMLGGGKVMTIPKAIRLKDLNSDGQSGRCLFVGTEMDVNVDALRWFFEGAWQEVLRQVSNAELHIYGTVCRKLTDIPKGVVLHGVVSDLEQAYADSHVVIIPLRAGSGVKIKLTEAVGYKRCCVSTTCGAVGLPALEHSGIQITDEPLDFAARVAHLLVNPAARSQSVKAMTAWADRYSSPVQCYGGLLNELRKKGIITLKN